MKFQQMLKSLRIDGPPVFLVLLLLIGCEKEHTTQVRGTVINFGTRQPIEGAIVSLRDGVGANPAFGTGLPTSSSKRTETLTDSDGHFDIKIRGEFTAFLFVQKDNCNFDPDWSDGIGIGTRGFKPGVHENVLCELKAMSCVLN